jgi:hypothetical protein
MGHKVKNKIVFSVYLSFSCREKLERLQALFSNASVGLTLSLIVEECINILYGICFVFRKRFSCSKYRKSLNHVDIFISESRFPVLLKNLENGDFLAGVILDSTENRFKNNYSPSPHSIVVQDKDGKFAAEGVV